MWEIRPNKACIAQIWFDWDAPRYGVKRLRNPISGECDIVKLLRHKAYLNFTIVKIVQIGQN
jgi:hypothetical protein